MTEEKVAKSTAGRLRDAIENDILTGVLAPGQRIDEQSLSKRFGVSRTPVREALAQLASDSQVELRPNKGAFVSAVRIDRLIQMFEVMGELEGMAGRLAAMRLRMEDRETLQRAMDQCVRAASSGDTDAYYYENEEFHQAIYAASHNGFLIEQCQMLQRRLRPYRRLQLRAVNRMRSSLAEHQVIVEAIFAGESSKAETALRAHVVIQGERFQDLVAFMAEAASLN
ncbi:MULTISPECIES: GntR family transcriptional regulator [unclassified Mesorhizobium]|uniref:GntR family transcriptional regulator n=1 Tax=unclassified Mesorhizobium TaxID=325217 RepID=UPI0024152631|nr:MULTISPECIES: GntR family transcriptional regulator [unclassified Mesorhizobium]MDG4889931.1 GntR family transcriptional regulator [Mesorhizobium sp. WSM4887]MDG4904074.1 GntR family transcriptional regulator [Mesorhizobium sp. WSM4962]MDG4909101.1 GntR family transcriptional regulator [Mesorhizobium sp. WSM4898]MDG4921725.1 GntR family transcriptional regulator [Mesorhizobium sp. WSM4989]